MKAAVFKDLFDKFNAVPYEEKSTDDSVTKINCDGTVLDIERFPYDEYDSLCIVDDAGNKHQIAMFIDSQAKELYLEFINNLKNLLLVNYKPYTASSNINSNINSNNVTYTFTDWITPYNIKSYTNTTTNTYNSKRTIKEL